MTDLAPGLFADHKDDSQQIDAGQVFAPIALFAFRRPDHTRRTLEALAANHGADRSTLVVFCDGARRDADIDDVEAVRRLVRKATGFAAVEIVEQPVNLGLARSIVDGVSALLARFPEVIVVEDDLVTSPHFLNYMNAALRLYADDEQVASVHGYVYPVDGTLPPTFFLRGADCWGWATWRRAWSVFEPDAGLLAARMRRAGLADLFDMDGAYPYMKMLKDCDEGKVDSWAIRWHASTFLENMLTLYPGRSLVQNIGHEGSGTHCDATEVFDVEMEMRPVVPQRIPLEVDEDARRKVADVMRRSGHGDAEAVVVPETPSRGLRGLWRRVTQPLFGRAG